MSFQSCLEYWKLSKYLALLTDLDTHTSVKRLLVQQCAAKRIYGMQELLYNIQHHKIALNKETICPLLENKALVRTLAHPKTALKKKLALLKMQKGLFFLYEVLPKLILEAEQGV